MKMGSRFGWGTKGSGSFKRLNNSELFGQDVSLQGNIPCFSSEKRGELWGTKQLDINPKRFVPPTGPELAYTLRISAFECHGLGFLDTKLRALPRLRHLDIALVANVKGVPVIPFRKRSVWKLFLKHNKPEKTTRSYAIPTTCNA